MRTPKIGDRVRVEFEGVVDDVSLRGDRFATIHTSDGRVNRVNVDACTVLAPPAKVGDLVTERNVEQLPELSIVAAPGCGARTRLNGMWWSTEANDAPRENSMVATFGAVILRVGGGQS